MRASKQKLDFSAPKSKTRTLYTLDLPFKPKSSLNAFDAFEHDR